MIAKSTLYILLDLNYVRGDDCEAQVRMVIGRMRASEYDGWTVTDIAKKTGKTLEISRIPN